MLRPALQTFKNIVEGRTVFLIGGGYSIEKYKQLPMISDKKIFCINSSLKYVESPIGVLWMDDSWASKNLDLLKTKNCSKFYVRNNTEHVIKQNKTGLAGCLYLNKTGEYGYDSDVNNVRGNNSGGAAINFLVNMKCKKIILLGFDMGLIENKAHFHREYDYTIRDNVYEKQFIPSINSLAEKIKNCNTEIINCTPNSKLNCFKKDYLENYI